ncbi:collagen-like protein [Spongiivirga sp. MCCC 1A20706]|uniref:collagen-like protein n=1 Tax=Spongiivirga sp. MCCC 1A20706 TaxID=3160963 RepID=UPI0039772B0F
MKNVLKTVFALSVILFTSCEGPEGPPGFDGRDGLDGLDGLDGVNIQGKIVDIEGDFNAANEFRFRFEFGDLDVGEDDVVLAYILWDEVDLNDGSTADLWRPLPQTRLVDQGIFQYNFEHTFFDIDLFLEGDFDLSTLAPADLEDQVFRIAIVPANLVSSGKIDPLTLGEQLNSIKFDTTTIQDLNF